MLASSRTAAARTLAARNMTTAVGSTYLGFDLSTQGLKATAIDSTTREIVMNTQLNFDTDLPHHGTEGGAIKRGGNVVNAPTIMFVEALDMLLARMADEHFDFGTVQAISGSGQQHGSVYWREGAAATLGSLAPGKLAPQLAGAFSFPDSPIWMDSSTAAQCAALEASLGGAQATASLTGSRAYERFTGNQIAKLGAANAGAYAATERISLISSAMPSILAGRYAAVDATDGAGMNLTDLRADGGAGTAWAAAALAAFDEQIGGGAGAPGGALAGKLGAAPVPAYEEVGKVAGNLVATYGFNPGCRVIAWSGDNPNSVAGLGMIKPGDIGVSLGTSDTIFGITAAGDSAPGLEGHVFPSPIDPASHMVMLCYKNGSRCRESVRDRVAGADWDRFANLVAHAPVGNGGAMGFFFDEPEITPDVKEAGRSCFEAGSDDAAASFADGSTEARAVLEGQFLSMRLHAEGLGIPAKRIIVTGGASKNPTITQVLADVFGVDVLAVDQPDSASLGAAYRAMQGDKIADAKEFVSFSDAVGDLASAYTKVAEPSAEAHACYSAMLPRYKLLEDKVVSA
jgi:xylulokinase